MGGDQADASVLLAVEQSYGIEREDISIASTRLMGFDRTLNRCERIEAQALMATGALMELEGQIKSQKEATMADDPQHDWLNANVSLYRRMPADLQEALRVMIPEFISNSLAR